MQASSKHLLVLAASLFALGCTGDKGNSGSTGLDGNSILVAATDEAAGANCAAGGLKLETGPDTNGDGVLDADEVNSTQYVCSGEDGSPGETGGIGLQSLIATAPLPVDGVCVFGGIQVDYGIDDNENGTLDANEIDGTSDVCNACPFSPAVFVKDFAALGTFTVATLDLDEAVFRTNAGDVGLSSLLGLGIAGSISSFIDIGEALTVTFSQPVYNISYEVNAIAVTGDRSIQAFDASGNSLGLTTDTSTGVNSISSAFGDVAISSFVNVATADSHRIRSMEFTFCP